jgi:hypothetical protein
VRQPNFSFVKFAQGFWIWFQKALQDNRWYVSFWNGGKDSNTKIQLHFFISIKPACAIKVFVITVGILHILCFEGSVRNVWRNWLLKHSVPSNLTNPSKRRIYRRKISTVITETSIAWTTFNSPRDSRLPHIMKRISIIFSPW